MSGVYAQTPVFKVMASSGKSSKGTVGLKVGTPLTTTDQITVATQSYLGLSYNKGGTIQISKAGTYSVKDLETKLLASKKTVSQKVADLVIGEITKNGDADIHKNPYKYQNVTGSVERATFMNDIVTMLPKSTDFFHSDYTIKWHKLVDNKTYIVVMMNQFDEVLKKVEVADTLYKVDFSTPELAETDMIKIKILSKERKVKEMEGFSFNLLEPKHLESFKRKLAEFKAGLSGNEQESAYKLELAMFYEEHGMLADAFNLYEEVTSSEPSNEGLLIAYNQFLIRHNVGPTADQIREQYK
jgi:hypothetical protein